MKRKYELHGGKGTLLYEIWCGMRQRCFNPNNKSYKNYGARGIIVCEEWNNFSNFRDWAIQNKYLDGLSIERINVNGNYEPENCCWIKRYEQSKNKRNTIKVFYNGEQFTLCELSNKYKIDYDVLYYRIVIAQMGIENALSKEIKNMPLKVGKSGERYIYKCKDGYQIRIHNKYCGFASTLEKAKEIRNLKLKELKGE